MRLRWLLGILLLAGTHAMHADDAPARGRLPLVFRGVMGEVAVLEDLETTTQASYRVGDTVRGARVIQIQPTVLTLDLAGERIALTIGDTKFAEGELRGDPAGPPCPWVVPDWARALETTYRETRVDLDFSGASLEEVARFLSDFTGTSLLIDPAARQRSQGPYSFTIKQTPVRTALDRILVQFGLALVYQDKVAVITTADRAEDNPLRKAFDAERGLVEARRLLDRVPEPASSPDATLDADLVVQLARLRLTATFADASLTEVVDFLHATTGLNFLVDPAVDPAAEANRVSASVRETVLRDFLDDLLRPRDLALVPRQGFVVFTSAVALQAEQEKAEAESEVRAAREEKEGAVLETPCSLEFDSEPLYRVAQQVTETTGAKVIVDPGLWGPVPRVTYAGGKTLQELVDALDGSNGVRHVVLRGTIYLLR